ncbi:MAG: two-component system sensor histidine kinase PilS [Nevskia sp.]
MLPELRIDAFANPEDWRVLRVLSVYRLLLVALLAALCLWGYGPYLFDQASSADIFGITLIYLLVALPMQLATMLRVPLLNTQAHLAFLVDAGAIIALMHVSRGVSSGLGVLLMTPAVGCSLVLPLRLGLLHAAIGTFALFGAEAWPPSRGDFSAAELTTTGLLGLMLFATALGAGAVAQRARKSEALAARVGSDLASASRLNERIVEAMDTPVIVLDEDRDIRLMNAAAKRLLQAGGASEGAAVAEVLPALGEALRDWEMNPNREPEPINLRDDGREVMPNFTRLGYNTWAPVLVLLDDATRVREQAQQLKLAALGRLSAGIAHEIRNPLSAIKHAGQLLAESPQLAPEDHRLLDMVQRHSLRIDKIVSDVLRLSRREAASPQSLPLRDFLERSIAVYREGCPNAERPIDLEAIPDGLRVRFDPNHLQQILLNLWQNSFDHGARSGRSVRVSLRAGRLSPGQRPYLDIGDDGAGIPAEQQDKLFEPFFTTAHHGTGLGLYLSRELCEYNQARLLYQPSEQGTQFRVIFAAG